MVELETSDLDLQLSILEAKKADVLANIARTVAASIADRSESSKASQAALGRAQAEYAGAQTRAETARAELESLTYEIDVLQKDIEAELATADQPNPDRSFRHPEARQLTVNRVPR